MASVPFSNQTMRQPVPGKPHIALIGGFWRVSPEAKRDRYKHPGRWSEAHYFTTRLNEPLLDKRFRRKPYRVECKVKFE